MYLPLRRTGDSLEFDRVGLIKQTIWDLDDQGKRLNNKPNVKDRVVVARTMLTMQKSTGALHGNVTMVVSSIDKVIPAPAVPCRVIAKEDSLLLITATPFYSDGFDRSGGYYPIASDVTNTYRIVDGKLQGIQESRAFRVDPETLQRANEPNESTDIEHEVRGLAE